MIHASIFILVAGYSVTHFLHNTVQLYLFDGNRSRMSTMETAGASTEGPGSKKATGKPTSGNKKTSRSSLTASLRSSIQSKIDYAQMPAVYKVPLWELQMEFNTAESKNKSKSVPLKEAVQHQRRAQHADVTILYAVRQVG